MEIKMTSEEKLSILDGARNVFFNAMLDGYVGGERKKSVKTKTPDGYVIIEFLDGDYRVVDRYCVTSGSNYSAGTTTIFFKGSPVWWMFYGGRYPEEVIPFLKESLALKYKVHEFHGGRGPRCHTGTSYAYENFVSTYDFSSFSGEERIISLVTTHDVLGFHKYFGMALM